MSFKNTSQKHIQLKCPLLDWSGRDTLLEAGLDVVISLKTDSSAATHPFKIRHPHWSEDGPMYVSVKMLQNLIAEYEKLQTKS